jgi:hypothetical protein
MHFGCHRYDNTEVKSVVVPSWPWKHEDFDRICPKISPRHLDPLNLLLEKWLHHSQLWSPAAVCFAPASAAVIKQVCPKQCVRGRGRPGMWPLVLRSSLDSAEEAMRLRDSP